MKFTRDSLLWTEMTNMSLKKIVTLLF